MTGRLEVFRFSNPYNYRDLRWDGISCVELVWEYANAKAREKTPRLCRRKCGHGPGGLLCSPHARAFKVRAEVMDEYATRIQSVIQGAVSMRTLTGAEEVSA